MPEPIPAIIMLPVHGQSPAEKWVGAGRLAASLDLVSRLQASGGYGPILAIVEDPRDEEALVALGVQSLQRDPGPFHFGRVLVACIQKLQFTQLAYFGGASAPLLSQKDLQSLSQRLQAAQAPVAIANNLYSTDWFLCNHLSVMEDLVDHFPSDNPFGWVYSQEAGITVLSEPASAATRLDIDTPMDLAMLCGHPAVGPHLRQFMDTIPAKIIQRVQEVKRVLKQPAQTLAVIGRASSHVWQQLEQQTQIWVRFFVEERGMVASQRLEHGEVRSLIADLVRALGPDVFIQRLAGLADAALWDTRVWMAAETGWPSAGDRFAADLGWLDQIQQPQLRELTKAIVDAPMPILAGGYGVVAGGLYALLESMSLD
jgi:hypothetical protein